MRKGSCSPERFVPQGAPRHKSFFALAPRGHKTAAMKFASRTFN